jgi:riboflavin synthase
MFTGLIEETGSVVSAVPKGGSLELNIKAKRILADLGVDDSVNVNGVCQTVVKVTGTGFTVQAVQETLRKTTLGKLRTGSRVNLERALLPTSRMGGHFVQGHVDGIGKVVSIQKQSGDWKIRVKLPDEFMKYVIPMGSICIDGVSLTVASVDGKEFTVAIIPHTLELTTLGDITPRSDVNIELDMIGKYIVNLIERTGTHHR